MQSSGMTAHSLARLPLHWLSSSSDSSPLLTSKTGLVKPVSKLSKYMRSPLMRALKGSELALKSARVPGRNLIPQPTLPTCVRDCSTATPRLLVLSVTGEGDVCADVKASSYLGTHWT